MYGNIGITVSDDSICMRDHRRNDHDIVVGNAVDPVPDIRQRGTGDSAYDFPVLMGVGRAVGKIDRRVAGYEIHVGFSFGIYQNYT